MSGIVIVSPEWIMRKRFFIGRFEGGVTFAVLTDGRQISTEKGIIEVRSKDRWRPSNEIDIALSNFTIRFMIPEGDYLSSEDITLIFDCARNDKNIMDFYFYDRRGIQVSDLDASFLRNPRDRWIVNRIREDILVRSLDMAFIDIHVDSEVYYRDDLCMGG